MLKQYAISLSNFLKTTSLEGGGSGLYSIQRHCLHAKTCLATKRGETGFCFYFICIIHGFCLFV